MAITGHIAGPLPLYLAAIYHFKKRLFDTGVENFRVYLGIGAARQVLLSNAARRRAGISLGKPWRNACRCRLIARRHARYCTQPQRLFAKA